MTHRGLASQWLNVEIEKTALKRPAEAEELASAILFLTSRMGSYMCANTLVADGGYNA
jgi:NAD(P)-dependent dehydrogenase (short-subunit alcohol dehydrogenase family)